MYLRIYSTNFAAVPQSFGFFFIRGLNILSTAIFPLIMKPSGSLIIVSSIIGVETINSGYLSYCLASFSRSIPLSFSSFNKVSNIFNFSTPSFSSRIFSFILSYVINISSPVTSSFTFLSIVFIR